MRSLETRLTSAKEENLNYKAQNSLLQGERKKADRAKKEAQDLREKLELMKNIEFVVNASSSEVNQKLHQMGDYSKASRELSYVNVTLKKGNITCLLWKLTARKKPRIISELETKAKEASHYRKEASSKSYKVDELKASAQMLQQSNEELRSDKAILAEDNRQLEEEIRTMKAKLFSLEEALNSPGGDARQSVINRSAQS